MFSHKFEPTADVAVMLQAALICSSLNVVGQSSNQAMCIVIIIIIGACPDTFAHHHKSKNRLQPVLPEKGCNMSYVTVGMLTICRAKWSNHAAYHKIALL